jgi:hypothetical protein
MKIEMALLWGGEGGWWELVVIEIPAIYNGKPYHLIDQVGRQAIMTMPEYDDINGCYCFNEMYG